MPSGWPWGSLGSSGVTSGRWVHLRSLGSSEVTVGGWVHSLSTWVSLCSSSVVRFTRIRLAGDCVHPGPLGSLGLALGVVGFMRGCWVHSRSPLRSLGSSGVVGFSRVHAGGR